MEKELADIERQKVTVKLAEDRLAFSRTEATRLNDEAERIVLEAELALRAERQKLIEFERLITAVNVATMFEANAKLVLVNPVGIAKKSYTTHTKDGESVRFAIKRIAYPLDVTDERIPGLLEPRAGQRVQIVKGGFIRQNDAFLRQLAPSTILETDVYELISKMKFTKHTDVSVFPINTKDIADFHYPHFEVKFGSYSGSVVIDGEYVQVGYYTRRMNKFTRGHLIFHVAQRTDLGRKRKTTGKTKDAEDEEE